MQLDSAFQIGKTHDICEDYALTGTVEAENYDNGYAIISDGCSSSSNVDLGARVLSFSAVREIENLYRHKGIFIFSFNNDTCITRARESIKSLGVGLDSLDATLLMAYADPYGVEILVNGDGAVVFGFDTGEMLVVHFEYESGFPFYPNYHPEYSVRYGDWRKKQIKEIDSEEGRHREELSGAKLTASVIDTDGNYEELEPEVHGHYYPGKGLQSVSFDQKETGGMLHFARGENASGKIPTFVAILSDGIDSFYKTEDGGTSLTKKNIDYREVIKEALNFKNFNGQFMQRRLNRFLKFCQKNNWHHTDDISFGAIYFE